MGVGVSMSSPVSVPNEEEPRKKRVRYKIPTYKKTEKIIKNIHEYQFRYLPDQPRR